MKLRLTRRQKILFSSYFRKNPGTFLITHLFFLRSIRHYADYIYIYFRWLDDMIDSTTSEKERIDEIARQRRFLDDIYSGRFRKRLRFQEALMQSAARYRNARYFRPFVMMMFRALEFDASRVGRVCKKEELMRYSRNIGYGYAQGAHYFSTGKGQNGIRNYLSEAAFAAHLVHILRDMIEDLEAGFINIPMEDIISFGLNLRDLDSYELRSWVKFRLDMAEGIFRKSKSKAMQLRNRKEKISFFIYCLRYEYVMARIKKDDYVIRRSYKKTLLDKLFFGMKVIGIILRYSIF